MQAANAMAAVKKQHKAIMNDELLIKNSKKGDING
jgi:hypothetical protein